MYWKSTSKGSDGGYYIVRKAEANRRGPFKSRRAAEQAASVANGEINRQLASKAMFNALLRAVAAAEHIIKVCEDDMAAGHSPSPFTRSNPTGALAECYAATHFITDARKAIDYAKGLN